MSEDEIAVCSTACASSTGLQVLEAMMEADRAVLCGPKGSPPGRAGPAWRRRAEMSSESR